jgi:hypothetical protein
MFTEAEMAAQDAAMAELLDKEEEKEIEDTLGDEFKKVEVPAAPTPKTRKHKQYNKAEQWANEEW